MYKQMEGRIPNWSLGQLSNLRRRTRHQNYVIHVIHVILKKCLSRAVVRTTLYYYLINVGSLFRVPQVVLIKPYSPLMF